MPRMDGVSFASLWVPWVCGEVTAQVRTRCGGGDGGSADPLGDVARGGAELASGDAIVWVLWWCVRATTVV